MEQVKHIEKIAVNNSVQAAYEPETKTIGEKEYFVVPVVMMVEGVHNGNQGAIYHSADELSKSVEKWEKKPVTISHPFLESNYVSVNSVQEEDWVVGYVTNPKMKDRKLTAEVYLDTQKLVALSPATFTAIQEKEIIEVSIGIFTDEELIQGVWNDEPYDKIATNHEPDHLALLPGEVGACSIQDGCGVRVNSSNKKKGGNNVELVVNRDLLKNLSDKGYTVTLIANASGLKEKLEKVRASLYSMESDTKWVYLEELYDDYAVFSEIIREKSQDNMYKEVSNTLKKQSYQLNDDGTVDWSGDATKVVKKVEYVQVNKKEVKMCVKCEEKAKGLIAHASTHFDDSDLPWLSELTEDKLDKLIPKVLQVDVSTPTLEDAIKVIQLNSKGLDDYLKVLPEEVRAQVEKGMQTFKEQKSATVQNILTNTEEGTWTEDELNQMSFEVLQKVEKSVVKTDFSINGLNTNQQEKGMQPLLPAGVSVNN
jgi:hypothetical protein